MICNQSIYRHKSQRRNSNRPFARLYHFIKDLTNRRPLHDGVVTLRDMSATHAPMSTCRSHAKVDDIENRSEVSCQIFS